MKKEPEKQIKQSNLWFTGRFGSYLNYLFQYRYIYKMLVENEFKGRFKYTVLGYFWHLLTPLTQIIIYLLIFTVIFGKDIPHYWVYISTGMFAFSFFMTCSAGASKCIIEKSSLVTKMAMAREIIVFSRVTTNLITLSISYVLLAVLMILSGIGVTHYLLYLPIIVISLTVFNTGLALFFSAVTVYVRDIANAINLLFGCMMFAIPIMYMPGTRSSPMMELIWSINPLYYYIETIHDVFYYGIGPNIFQMGLCIIFALASLIIGFIVFKWLERGFAERL